MKKAKLLKIKYEKRNTYYLKILQLLSQMNGLTQDEIMHLLLEKGKPYRLVYNLAELLVAKAVTQKDKRMYITLEGLCILFGFETKPISCRSCKSPLTKLSVLYLRKGKKEIPLKSVCQKCYMGKLFI